MICFQDDKKDIHFFLSELLIICSYHEAFNYILRISKNMEIIKLICISESATENQIIAY